MNPRAFARAVVRFWMPPPGILAALVTPEDVQALRTILCLLIAAVAILTAVQGCSR